jgi:hypothetical protein
MFLLFLLFKTIFSTRENITKLVLFEISHEIILNILKIKLFEINQKITLIRNLS